MYQEARCAFGYTTGWTPSNGWKEAMISTTFNATIEHVTHTTSRATVRTHTFLVDRGVAKGGFDLGPAGREYMLVSLGGCFTSHLLAAIRAR